MSRLLTPEELDRALVTCCFTNSAGDRQAKKDLRDHIQAQAEEIKAWRGTAEALTVTCRERGKSVDKVITQRDEFARALINATTFQENWQDHKLIENARRKAKEVLGEKE